MKFKRLMITVLGLIKKGVKDSLVDLDGYLLLFLTRSFNEYFTSESVLSIQNFLLKNNTFDGRGTGSLTSMCQVQIQTKC